MGNAFGGPRRDDSGGGLRKENGADERREAVLAKELKRLRLQVQRGRGLDKQGELVWAVLKDRLEVVQFLVEECSADVNVQDNDGWTALVFAVSGGHMDIVRFLVEQCSANVDIQTANGSTPLMLAARSEHMEIVQCLVNEGGANVNIQDDHGSTALTGAAHGGHLDIVRFLVGKAGANVNIHNKNGATALTLATGAGHLNVMRALVEECGADVSILGEDARALLMEAACGGHLDVVRFLVIECAVQDTDGSRALTLATRGGHLDVVRFLVNEGGADVNGQDNNGFTALMLASRGGNIDVVRFLVGEGAADVNVQDNDRSTALALATRGGYMDVVRFLVNEGSADVNIQDNDGWTALMRAACNGHVDVVRSLVEECAADVNIQDTNGSTALKLAADGGRMGVVRFLVNEGGADVNTQDKDGFSALMRAAARDHMNVVRFLVNEGGADVNIRNAEARTAIRIASDYGYNDIVRLLTPFAQHNHRSTTQRGHKLLASDASRSYEIAPCEVELGEFYEQRNIGGDFRVKWLGADAVVKLFVPDASGSTFEQELRAWQELRHPNVLKLYGVCQAAPNVNFFVCEYASQGSLAEYTMAVSSASRRMKPLVWKYLYEAALGLEYLHERGIIHGDLRCSNVLIGNDGMAKLSNFGPTDVATNPRSVIRSMRWQSPEVLTGNPPSRESDVYSLGMCIFEAASGTRPWATSDDRSTQYFKLYWNAHAHASVPYNKHDPDGPFRGIPVRSDDSYFVRRSRELVWLMCRKDPRGRSNLTFIVSELERLSIEELPDAPQPEAESASCFEGCTGEDVEERWDKLHECMDDCDNAEHCQVFDKLQYICARLQESDQSQRLLDRFYSLVTDFYRTVKMTPEEAWAMQLSSTRATTTSMISFGRRVDGLLKALGESVLEEKEMSWQQQRREQGSTFVSGITDTVLLLQSLKSVEEQSALLNSLRSEIESPEDKYSEEQLRTMKKTYDAIESKLATEGVENTATLTPEWFIPWYELILDEGEALGAGGFGSVRRAKWLDSDVVVKEVLLPGSDRTASSDSFYDSMLAPIAQTPTDPQIVAKRAEARAMFRREADIWFGFSHPHVVRLFGACHIGRPFFVCEYATHGTLDRYLRKHTKDLWAKLHEAALGVQYLHAREVVHGDLKGNNIVVGSDLKAKVTDFGLSLVADSDATAPISAAWHWVAPECMAAKKTERAGVKTTFESDVYSLGMCIVEALRIVEPVQDGKPSYGCLPWGMLDPLVVKHKATRGEMPSRPLTCTDEQWNLVTRMCALDPKKRIKISTVVDELERFLKTPTGTYMNSIVSHVAHIMTALTYPVNHESVVTMTAAARKVLSQLQGNNNQPDNSPAGLYDSLWDRIEDVGEQIDGGNHEAACKSAFHSLVVEVRTSTASLEAKSGDLFSLAQVVMGCYALSRRLDKLCDAYFLKNPSDLAFPKVSDQKRHPL